MSTLQAGSSPSTRITNGDAILNASTTGPIKTRLTAFARVHKGWAKKMPAVVAKPAAGTGGQ